MDLQLSHLACSCRDCCFCYFCRWLARRHELNPGAQREGGQKNQTTSDNKKNLQEPPPETLRIEWPLWWRAISTSLYHSSIELNLIGLCHNLTAWLFDLVWRYWYPAWMSIVRGGRHRRTWSANILVYTRRKLCSLSVEWSWVGQTPRLMLCPTTGRLTDALFLIDAFRWDTEFVIFCG